MSFDLRRFEAERSARKLELGSPIAWQELTESTNDDALVAAKSQGRHGAVFGAETQTRGRGRRGSEWVSTPGAGLWFSLLLRPELDLDRAPALALCAGLAVREAAAARVSADVHVKWPNDVLAPRLKLAGILVESQVSGTRMSSAIVGIGINVSQQNFPEPVADIATSLALLGGSDLSREGLLADVLQGFQVRLQLLEHQGLSGIASELRQHDALLGQKLRVEGRTGTGAGIDDDGRLLLRVDDGTVQPLLSGHVELLP